MAIFKDGDEDDLDYAAIRDGGISIYRNLRFLEEDVRWLQDHKYRIHKINCTKWVSEDAMHESLYEALSFPTYYGKNLNALNDVIPDLDVPYDGGLVLVLLSYNVYAAGPGSSPAGVEYTPAEIVLDILSRASHSFLLTGKRFLTMLQSNDPKINFRKVGGHAPTWNHREWLWKNRGL